MNRGGCRRGYMPSDEHEFVEQIDILRKAACDVGYLLDAGYPVKNATVFVGNHYLLSERQRLALARSVAPKDQAQKRRRKELPAELLNGAAVHIDTFNTVIALETAFSGSILLRCMDGAVRDLAGLRGTYRLIDKTEQAVDAIKNVLVRHHAAKAFFYLDAPVSNSGRLKQKIAEAFAGSGMETEFHVIRGVDRILMNQDIVITGDSVILDHCRNWYNLVYEAVRMEIGNYPYVEVWR